MVRCWDSLVRSRLFERSEPCRQNVERKAALTSILKQATPSVSVPRHPSLNGDRNIELASILEQVAAGPSSASILDVSSMSEFIEQRLSFTRGDIPVFQPSQPPAAISVPRQHASQVPRQHASQVPHQLAPPAISMPRQSQIGEGKVLHQHAGLTLEGRVPPSVSVPRQHATVLCGDFWKTRNTVKKETRQEIKKFSIFALHDFFP